MAKGLPRSMARAAPGRVTTPIVKQTIDIIDRIISVADGAPGFGSVVLGDFPEGNILFFGAVSYLTFTTADADVIATFDGDYALGTVPTADGDFGESGEANLIPSTALGAATAKVSPLVRGTNVTPVMLDNTDGSLEVNLNLLIDDAAISGAADFTVDGVVMLSYVVLGDD
jgi:hypothetical protein